LLCNPISIRLHLIFNQNVYHQHCQAKQPQDPTAAITSTSKGTDSPTFTNAAAVLERKQCLRLDSATGQTSRMPQQPIARQAKGPRRG
jgi:hypothetical protein